MKKCLSDFCLPRMILPVWALLSLLSGCRRIPLHDPAAGVYLQLDFRLAADVPAHPGIGLETHPEYRDKLIGKKPETVRVCFYDAGSHELVAEDFLPSGGGFIDLPAGVYDMILYSLGTESTRVAGTETRGGAYAYTSRTGTRVKAGGTKAAEAVCEYPVIHEPDHLFVARRQVVVPVHAAGEDRTVVIETEAESVVQTYSLEVLNVVGAGRIREAEVFVTGQIPSCYLWDLHCPYAPAAICFPSVIDGEKGRLFTVFNTFGKYPQTAANVYLNVLVTSGNGSRYQWVFDVTDQFDNPDNTAHEIIIDEAMVVPEDGGGGGFTPAVGDWEAEIIEVPLT
ncbi:MAG: DUF5119 domain-containing protein [Bacteroidales bacterium]|nr:DUF5119 domain-containing protein [Bacteroidales bacterium]